MTMVRTMLLAGVALGGLGLGVAQAQPVTGLYIGAGGGGNYAQDQRVKPSPGLGTPGLRSDYQFGEAAVGSVGYGFGNGLRIELEGNFRNNPLRELHGTSFPTKATGGLQTYGAMVNALFDLDIGQSWIYPYFGGGVGWAQSKLQNYAATGTGTPFQLSSNGQWNDFAYQGIFGLSFPVPPVVGLSATIEYRFYGLLDSESYKAAVISAGSVPGTLNQARGNLDMTGAYNHSVLVGLRYQFNVPRPPAPPAPAPAAVPAPAAARTYLVFFDWDRADLTSRARQIIAEAASASTRVAVTRIEVNGYTDLSGTAAYNQKLSVRRADAVAAELVRDGVPRGEIMTQGFGETHPLVPTAQGVREPQNRRVEIILH